MEIKLNEAQRNGFLNLSRNVQIANNKLNDENQKLESFLLGLGVDTTGDKKYSVKLTDDGLQIDSN